MKKSVLFIGLVVFLIKASGQPLQEIDSLQQLLQETHDFNKKTEIYTTLSRIYHNIDPHEAKKYANLGINLSFATGAEKYLGDLYGSLGDIAIKEDSMYLGEKYYLKASEYFKLDNRQRDLVKVMNILGNIQFMRNRYAAAMTWYLDAIGIAEKNGFKRSLAHLYHNIGAIYINANSDYTEALKNFSSALDLFEAFGDSTNMANVNLSLGETYSRLNDTALALIYFKKAKALYTQTHNPNGIAQSTIGIAGIMSSKGEYAHSNELIHEALNLFTQNDKYYAPPPSTLLSRYYNNLGSNYYFLHDYSKSIEYYQKAYALGQKNKQTEVISSASEGISNIWNIRGNVDSAFYYFRIYKRYSDSLINEENIKKLTMLEARNKYEQTLNLEKQKRQDEKEKSRMNYLILAFVISGLVLAIIIMFLILKLWRNRVRRSDLEQKALKNELETRNKELTTHVMYQIRKNEFILSVIKKLRESVYRLKIQNRDLIEDIIKDLERNADNVAWKDFEVRFHRVHVDFNNKLLQRFPDLTANELRLCAFLRLNMNTKEIAAITYQTANSIDTARSRLRQKLGLGKDDHLVGFLMQF